MADKFPRRKVRQDIAPRKSLSLDVERGMNGRKVITEFLTSPEVSAARGIQAIEGGQGIGGQLDIPELVSSLKAQAEAVNGGSLACAEGMLMSQATTLQAIFTRLIERAVTKDRPQEMDAMMRLALKAQSQCRATLETLSALKNPPVVFAKQANIAAGHQQINNGTAQPVREIVSEQIQQAG